MLFNKRTLSNLFCIKSVLAIGLAYSITILPGYSQQIIPDGYTNTNLDINGKTTSVYTGTIKGSNAFNSFSKFDVYQGNTVNLVIPGQSSNLINIIKNQASNIDGILNSIKNNQIGGNIFLVNPHGIFVGKQGIINVGSLTAITPTKAFTDSFFDSPGNPDDNAVNILLNGKVPLNTEANVYVGGQIKAIEKVKIDTGILTNTGTIQIADIVNLDNVKNAAKGEIIIQTAKDIINTGNIIANGTSNSNAGIIDIDAANNIQLATNSLVSAKGQGSKSNGGNINILAQNNNLFDMGAIIDVSGGNISGDGGFVELSANKSVQLSGEFKAAATNGAAGSVLVDPPTLDIVVNQFTNGANMTFQADNTLTVANEVILSSRKVDNPTTANHLTAHSTGNSGNITLSSNNVILGLDSKIYAQADGGFTPGNINLLGTNNNATVKLGGLTYTNGTLQITSAGSISNTSYTATPYAVGGIINLVANIGKIGAADGYIMVNLFDSISGSINATATDNIYLKSNKDMRIGQINTPADVYLLANKAKIVDALNGQATNVTANNLFVQLKNETQNFYFIGITGDANSEDNGGFMTYYMNTLKNKGDNWLKTPSANFKIFDDTIADFTDEDVLSAITTFANKLKPGDVLYIAYKGHGYGGNPNPQFGEPGNYSGNDIDPIDEDVPGSKALNGADEGMAFGGYYIRDDQFADALKSSKGTVVFLSGQCYGGGMFGGTYDIDQVAQRNGFSYYGVAGNIEGRLAWASQYKRNDQTWSTISKLHMAMLDSLTETAPKMTSMDFDATSRSDWHWVNFDKAYNANGNVCLNEWYNAVNKEPSYYSTYRMKDSEDYYTYHYPYQFAKFTNMTTSQLQNNPILYKSWDPVTTYLTDSIGTNALPLNVKLAGNLQVAANNAINIAGDVTGASHVISNNGIINLTGKLNGSVTATSNNDVTIYQTAGNLSINKVTANNSTATIVSVGNLLNASANNTTNVLSKNVFLQSNTGTIGTLAKAFGITTTGGGSTAFANGLINLAGMNSDLFLDVISNAGRSDVYLTASKNILDGIGGNHPNIYARGINLVSNTGSIGTAKENINFCLNYTTTGGYITASANNLINIKQHTGDLFVNVISNNQKGDINIYSEGSILDGRVDESANIIGNKISLTSANGTLGNAIHNLDLSSADKVSAFANGLINLKEVNGDLTVNTISNAGRDNVIVTAQGNILNGLTPADTNIYAKGITLTSSIGNIGSNTQDPNNAGSNTIGLNTYLNYKTTGGVLNATAPGSIYIKQNTGHLMLDKVNSTGDDVKLYCPGNILNMSADNNPNITGNNITLINVSTGSIGLYDRDVNIHLNGGALTAQAYGYVGIKETTGEMKLNLVSNAGRSDVKLTAFGNLLDTLSNNNPKIYSRGITLISNTGNIGSANHFLDLYLNYNSSGGVLTTNAAGSKYITQH